jgi:N-acetylneuraminate synthase
MNTKLSHQSAWSKSVYDIYNDASLPDEWTALLKEKCDSVGIEYMTSPYDFASVDLANKYSNCFKIGSGDITWLGIIEYIAKNMKPVILATGASDMADVDRAMTAIMKYTSKIVLMQCNTNYTAEVKNFKYINLNVLKIFRERYPDIVLGLSDHTHGYETVLGAIVLGARVIEKHFTDDNDREGPDHKFSMTPKTWKQMVSSANLLFNALGDGVKKVEENEKDTAVVQRRALYYTRHLKAGECLQSTDLIPLRPILSDSVPPYEIDTIIGKKMEKDVSQGNAVNRGDFL